MSKDKINLFRDDKECCNCGACRNICPKDAIQTYEDNRGFRYPKINDEKCIKCGLCKKVCAFQNIEEVNVPIKTYVSVSNDKKLMENSASGGIFASIAKMYIENNGIVYGAAFDENINPVHIGVDNTDLLYKVQGSKYVQSSTEDTFKQVKKNLELGKKVLFSGTPCQVAGLKGFLLKDYENLLTIDIVCHGVPNAKFFKDYLEILEQKNKGKIIDFKFRDKSIGWGTNGSVTYEKNGFIKKKKIYSSESSYYHYFLNCECYRESCYSCKYAGMNRPGDITLGDYWGIEIFHSDLLDEGIVNEDKGVSLVLVNSEYGEKILKQCKNLQKYESEFSNAIIKNGQLKFPSKKGSKYNEIMRAYESEGYTGVERIFNKQIGIKKYKSRVKSLLPIKIKRKLKKYF